MTDHLVIGVRKEPSADATHTHISEVCTAGPIRYSRQEVIDSIRAGERWEALCAGPRAEIHIAGTCPHRGCSLGPYLTTGPDSSEAGDLDDLGPC